MPKSNPPDPATSVHTHHRASVASVALRILLILVPIGASCLTWFAIGALFGARSEGASAGSLGSLIAIAAVGEILLLASIAVSVIVNPHARDHAVVIVAAALSVLAAGATPLTVVAALLVILALGFWRHEMLVEARSRIRFTFVKSARAGIGWTLALIGLAIALQSVAPAQLLVNPEQASARLLDAAARSTQEFIPVLVRGAEPSKTIDAYLDEVARSLEQGKSPLVPFPGLEVEGAPTTEALRQQLSENLHISLTGRETLGDIIQRTVRERLEPAIAQLTTAIVPLFVLSVFLIIQLVNPLIGWLAVGLSAAAFTWTKASGTVRVVREKADVDRLQLQ